MSYTLISMLGSDFSLQLYRFLTQLEDLGISEAEPESEEA